LATGSLSILSVCPLLLTESGTIGITSPFPQLRVGKEAQRQGRDVTVCSARKALPTEDLQ
jgi:hypothetical protein